MAHNKSGISRKRDRNETENSRIFYSILVIPEKNIGKLLKVYRNSFVLCCAVIFGIIVLIMLSMYMALPKTALVHYVPEEIDNFTVTADNITLFSYKNGDRIETPDMIEFEVHCPTARINGSSYAVDNNEFLLRVYKDVSTDSTNNDHKPYFQFISVEKDDRIYSSPYSFIPFYDAFLTAIWTIQSLKITFGTRLPVFTSRRRATHDYLMLHYLLEPNLTDYPHRLTIMTSSLNIFPRYMLFWKTPTKPQQL